MGVREPPLDEFAPFFGEEINMIYVLAAIIAITIVVYFLHGIGCFLYGLVTGDWFYADNWYYSFLNPKSPDKR